jgi:hypothetical protein
MVGAVIDMRTRKHLVQFPKFQMLAGDYDFPLWFVREGMEQLKANEPYALCSGIGFVLRYWHWVTTCVNPEVDMARFEKHVMEYPKNWPDEYVNHVIMDYVYQLDVIRDGLKALNVPLARRGTLHHEQVRNVKRMRDDMENVKRILGLLNQPVSAEIVDNQAQSMLPSLADNHDYLTLIEPRLNTLYDHFPHYWWGVKGTL